MTYLSQSHLFVDPMKADIKAERLIAGITTNGQGDNFTGCWIGCAVREYNHEKMAEKLNWPLPLVRISERIFEGLKDKDAEQAFAVDVLAAPKPNADMSLVHWKFLHWMVKDTLEKYADEKTQEGCAKALQVLLDKSNGIEVSHDAADAAADAAAYAARAADAAARAAYAAARAAYAAARPARAAADAAAADAAADAAYAAAYAAYAAAYAAARAAYAAARPARAAAAAADAAAAAAAADAAYAAAADAAARFKELGAKLLELMAQAPQSSEAMEQDKEVG